MATATVQVDSGSIEAERNVVPAVAWSERQFGSDALESGQVAAPPRGETAHAAAQRLVRQRVPLVNEEATEFEAHVLAATDRGRGQMSGRARLVRGETPQGARSGYLLGALGPLILLLLVDPSRPELTWTLVPGGRDVTQRADALTLLRALSGEGTLHVQDLTRGELSTSGGGVQVPGFEWMFENEWRLFEDLATIVEWSGVEIAQPKEVTAEQATQVAQAAHWIRTERIEARLTGPLSFRGDPDKVHGANELRMEENFGVHLLGQNISLGTGGVRVRLKNLEIGATGEDGLAAVRGWAEDDRVLFGLQAPTERRQPAQRTQRASKPRDTVAAGVRQAMDEVGIATPKRDLREALATFNRRAVEPNQPSGTSVLQRLREDRLS